MAGLPPPPRRHDDARGGPAMGNGGPSFDGPRGGWDGPAGPSGYGGPPPVWDDRRGPVGGPMGMGGMMGYDDRRGPPPPPRGGALPGNYGGGRRSPDWDGRKRRRSLSPRRDPYYERPPLPRDSRDPYAGGRPPYRDDYYRGPDARVLPPFGYLDGSDRRPQPSMQDPLLIPYQVTFRYFTDWFREAQPTLAGSQDALDDAFKKYKKEFARRSHAAFFEDAKEMAWFKEKYEATKEMEQLRKGIKLAGTAGKMDLFLTELEEGKLDNVNFDLAPKKEVSAENGSTTNGNGSIEGDVKMEDDAEAKPKVEASESGDGDMPAGVSGSMIKLETDGTTLVLKSVPKHVTRKELEEHCARAPGFEYLALSEPNQAKNFSRVGWAKYSSLDDMPKAFELISESRIGDFTIHAAIAEQSSITRMRITPSIMSTPERITKDLDQIRLLAQTLEKDLNDTRGSAAIELKHAAVADGLGGEALEALTKKTLDLYIHYLRVAHNACYYCPIVCEFRECLERKCPRHVRRTETAPVSKKAIELDNVKALDDKLPLLIKNDSLDLTEYGGEDEEQETRAHIKHEEEGKFRCTACQKLFSAIKFVEKHLSTKHPELVDVEKIAKLKFFNNYVLDPARLPLPEREQSQVPPGPNGDLRPLSDRIGGRLDDRALGNMNKRRRGSEMERDNVRRGPPPPPPVDAVMDPRAGKGRQSYADLDGAPSGAAADVILPY